MGKRFSYRAQFTVVLALVVVLSQFIPIANVRANTINNGDEFFDQQRTDYCSGALGNCDALMQYGINDCVVSAASGGSFFSNAQNGSSSSFNSEFNNYSSGTGNYIAPTNKIGAYALLTNLLAYYYGVNPDSSCSTVTTLNTGFSSNLSAQYSLDNIGASFAILSLLYGSTVPAPTNSTYYYVQPTSSVPDGYVHIDSSILNTLVRTIHSDDAAGLVCQGTTQIQDTYNTAMDVRAPFDVGRTPQDSIPRPMLGILNTATTSKCGSVNTNNYQFLIDVQCGNISVNDTNPQTPVISCSISSSSDSASPKVGVSVSFYINWKFSPQTTKIKSTEVYSSTSPGSNIAPASLQSIAPSSVGGDNVSGYSLSSSQNPTSATSITYTGNMTINVANSSISPETITCTHDTVTWGSSCTSCCSASPCSQTPLVCTNSIQPTLDAKKVYDTAYTAWYNYDQATFQPYKTKTDAAAATLAGPLTTYLADVAIYNNDVQIVNQIIQTYQNQLAAASATEYNAYLAADSIFPTYNPPSAPTLQSLPAAPTLQSLPAAPGKNATKAQITAYNNAVNSINAANRITTNNYNAEVRSINNANTATTNAYNAQVSSINAANVAAENQYQTALNNYNTNYNNQVAIDTPIYNADIAAATLAYNNSVASATATYNASLPPAQTNEANARNAAIAAYNAMQPEYQPWVALSEQTYNTTTLYYDSPSFYTSTYINNGSYYNQDLNLYNAMETDLTLWKAALQQEDLVCDTKPYFTVTGGDIIAGPGFTNASCVPNNSANIYASNIGVAPWTGASDNLAALAPGTIYDLSTGTGGNQLTFANTTGAFPSAGNFGSTNGTCSQDYYGTSASVNGFSSLPIYQGSFNLASATGSSSCTQMDTTYYCRLGNSVDITGNPPTGSKIVLYIAGNAEIGGTGISFYNNYLNTGLGAAADIPLLYVIASGNIYVDNTASSIDGVYVASNTIFTCANNGQSFSSDTALISGCASNLTVNGSLVANQIKLGRVYGGLSSQYGYPVGQAETFTYGPQVWLSQVRSSIPVNPDYQDLTELSPVV